MSQVQFNLLPDVKLNYLKLQHTRNRVLSIAILVSGVALVLFLILLFSVEIVQKKQLNDANKEVTLATRQLQNMPDLNKVLTVQNQLKTLVGLHQDKHAGARFFGYLSQITPTDVKISNVAVDFVAGTMAIAGTANSQHAVNTFIDTLKFTTYQTGDQNTTHAAFPSVIETSFSVVNRSAYSLTVQFDPQLFSNNLQSAPVLTVPKLTTTRVNNDPANTLFQSGGHTPSGGQ